MATAQESGQGGVPLSELEKRVVVAHNADREQVLRQGTAVVQRPQGELAVWPVLSDMALAHDPPAASEF